MNAALSSTKRGGERLRRGTPEHAARLEGMVALARGGWTLVAIAGVYGLSHQAVAYALRGAGLTIAEARNIHCASCGKLLSRARFGGGLTGTGLLRSHYCAACGAAYTRDRKRRAWAAAGIGVGVCAHCQTPLRKRDTGRPTFCRLTRECRAAADRALMRRREAAVTAVGGWIPPAGGGTAPVAAAPLEGAALRALREAAGLSQRELAARAFCSRGIVAGIERERRQSLEMRRHLAAVLVAQKAVQP